MLRRYAEIFGEGDAEIAGVAVADRLRRGGDLAMRAFQQTVSRMHSNLQQHAVGRGIEKVVKQLLQFQLVGSDAPGQILHRRRVFKFAA
jgi:hypothetical protein